MGHARCLQAELRFRHGPHAVRLLRARSSLALEVEARTTADQWRGEFGAAAIEELTQKTGNFKQFGIFCAMLEAALLQSSDCVRLELLTYPDLELLRSRKAGMGARSPGRAPAAGSALSARRYLILVYCVEFDRIHYPLPLSYVGRPDPATLQRQLQELRQEVEQLRARHRSDPRDAEIQRLREQLQEQLRSQDELRCQLRELQAQLEAVKASEQSLKLRLRSLPPELAASRRGNRTPGSRERRPPARSPSPAAPPRFDPTAFVRARQRRQQQLQPHNQRRGAGVSSSPARSKGRSSSAESCRSRRSVLSSSSGAEEPPQRQRRTPQGRRPLSTLSCNGARAGQRVTSCKPPTTKRPSKENQHETELAEIDARLEALQEVMARMLPPCSQWEPPGTHM